LPDSLATHPLEAGYDAVTVQELPGHSRFSTTQYHARQTGKRRRPRLKERLFAAIVAELSAAANTRG